MYHSISSSNVADDLCMNLAGMTVPQDTFCAQMKYVAENFTTINFSRFMQWKSGEASLPERPCILTFDDGFLDVYENAVPVLRAFNLRATFFIIGLVLSENKPSWLHEIYEYLDNSDITEFTAELRKLVADLTVTGQVDKISVMAAVRNCLVKMNRTNRQNILNALRHTYRNRYFPKPIHFMNSEQICDLATCGFEIGCHTMRHEYCSAMSDSELCEDIRQSKGAIVNITNHEPCVFAYPFGGPNSFDNRCFAALEREGFLCACSTIPGLNHKYTPNFALRRICVSEMSLVDFRLNLTKSNGIPLRV